MSVYDLVTCVGFLEKWNDIRKCGIVHYGSYAANQSDVKTNF